MADGGVKRKAASPAVPSNSKRALKKERQASRPNNDVVESSKSVWNELRKKENSKERVRELADELFGIVEGKMGELAKKHDASRVIQAVVQFGTEEQRAATLKELVDDIPELSKQQYSHFIVLKMLKYCMKDQACRKMLVKALKNNVVKLATHQVGARVVEVYFQELPGRDSEILRREFFGKQYSMFTPSANATATPVCDLLKCLLEEHADKKASILAHVLGVVNKLIEKKLLDFTYTQELIYMYVTCASAAEVADFGPSLVDHTLHVCSTRPGASALAWVAAYAVAKDRKRVMKALKGYARSTLMHGDAYIAVIRVIQVTDDTVSVQKMLLNELLRPAPAPQGSEPDPNPPHPLLDIAMSKNASKLLLMLLSNSDGLPKQYFDPWELDVLAPALMKNESGELVPTSRKNPSTRRAELRQFLKDDVLAMVSKHAAELAKDKAGGKVLVEALKCYDVEVSSSIATALGGDGAGELFDDPTAHLTLKRCFLACKEAKDGSALPGTFLKGSWAKVKEALGSSRGAFVVSALCEASDEAKTKVKGDKALMKLVKEKKGGQQAKGYETLAKVLKD